MRNRYVRVPLIKITDNPSTNGMKFRMEFHVSSYGNMKRIKEFKHSISYNQNSSWNLMFPYMERSNSGKNLMFPYMETSKSVRKFMFHRVASSDSYRNRTPSD